MTQYDLLRKKRMKNNPHFTYLIKQLILQMCCFVTFPLQSGHNPWVLDPSMEPIEPMLIHCCEKITLYLEKWEKTTSFPDSAGSLLPFFGS